MSPAAAGPASVGPRDEAGSRRAFHLQVLKQIETYYSREGLIKEIPEDTGPEEFETLLKAT